MSKDNPCWKYSSDYPDPKETNLLQWAWEFFRRNPGYRADYNEFVSLPDEVKSSGILADGTISRFCQCDPPALPNEKINDYLSRVGIDFKSIAPPMGYFIEKYYFHEIPFYPNPYIGSVIEAGVIFKSQPIRMLTYEYLSVMEKMERSIGLIPSHRGMVPRGTNEVVVKIDLDMPLDVQFKTIESTIRDTLKSPAFKRRNHVEKFPIYLRAYDAKTESVGVKEIADTIGVDDAQMIYNYLKAAEEIIVRDYWKLAAQHQNNS